MDNYDIVLDLIEHPENYSPDQIEKILADPDNREIYNILCNSASALNAETEIDDKTIDKEWDKLTAKKKRNNPFGLFKVGSRAAIFAAVILTSATLLAIGVAISMSKSSNNPSASSSKNLDLSVKTSIHAEVTESVASDSLPVTPTSILFEDASLETILDSISIRYGMAASFTTPETAGLHLYYKLDSNLPIADIIGQLNTFEQINIRIDGNSLIVD